MRSELQRYGSRYRPVVIPRSFSSSAVRIGLASDSRPLDHVLLANNILYAPEASFITTIENAELVTLLHNTLWGRHDGMLGGLAIGAIVTDVDLFNNVILSVSYEALGGTVDAAEHRGDYNLFGRSLGQWVDGAHDVIANDPLFAAIPAGDGAIVTGAAALDFTPQAASPARSAGSPEPPELPTAVVLPPSLDPPLTDFFGNARGSPPTIGAIE